MNRVVINEFLDNAKLLDHLKDHSYYIKNLNRSIEAMKVFKKDMKVAYHERASDKVADAIDGVEMIASVLDTL